jgi:tetratricopeptide (TPR) repeat protein/transcriptional regulator with XRE-family HTH domain
MTPRRHPNDRLRALLREADWTQEALARAVNSLGAEIGCPLRYDRTAVAHWLSGTQPRHPVPQLAAEALSRRTGRSVTPQAAGFPVPDHETTNEDPVSGFTALCRGDADASRRAPLQQRPYRVAESQVTEFPATRPAAPPAGNPAEEAAALRDAACFFAASIDTHGGRHARSALASYLADDVTPLLSAHRPPQARVEIMIAASRLAFLLARMYEDGQLHGLAQRYYAYAHRLAAESGDRTSWCMAVRAMSSQAARLGHLASALQLAEAAGRAVHGAPAAQQAYVRAQLAVVLARSGDRRAALGALAAAERAAERSSSGGSPFDCYPSAALYFQSSLALEALGDLPAALGALRRSAGERPPSDVRGRTLTQARFGQLLLRTGHLDEACAAWKSFLTGQERLRSGDAERALRDMRCALRPFRNRRGAAELLARSAPRTERR